jgi:two-component system, NarL family, response regulator LiaR
MPTDITVLIADDHDLVRAGLVQFLDVCEGIEVIGAASNGAEAVEQCGKLQPQVVLMDLSMPVMDGIAATRIICQKYPDIRVVILTNSYGDTRKQEALEAGASKYLRKGVSVQEISDALRAAAQ